MSSSNHRIQRHSVERLRVSTLNSVEVLIQGVLGQQIERIDPSCVADLFALTDARLPGSVGVELGRWAARAEREIRDLPASAARTAFVAEVAELPADQVPASLREIILSLPASGEVADAIAAVRTVWEATPPAAVVLPTPPRKAPVQSATLAPAAKVAAAKAEPAKRTAAPAAPRAVKTPAAMIDPRRAQEIREDALSRLKSPEYLERGLKESILVAGIRHRSKFKDLTEAEVKAELRKLEREQKLKHTGERWLSR